MTVKKAARAVRGSMRAAALAGQAMARGTALASGAADVIGKRVAMGALLPTTLVAGAEAARMVPEKAAALSAGTLAGGAASAKLAASAWRFAFAEFGHAGRAAASMAGARSPAGLAMAQFTYMAGLFGRMADATVTASQQAIRANLAMTAPAHRTVAGNARRLRRGGGAS